MEGHRAIALPTEAPQTRAIPQPTRAHRPGVPAGLDVPLERIATAADRPIWPEAADAAPATARAAGVLDAQLEPLRVEARDRLASYREFGTRFVSGVTAAALLACLVALVAWLR